MSKRMNIRYLGEIPDRLSKRSLCLNEIRINLAANLGRSPLSHSYSYGSADDPPTLLARFPPNIVPFARYAG